MLTSPHKRLVDVMRILRAERCCCLLLALCFCVLAWNPASAQDTAENNPKPSATFEDLSAQAAAAHDAGKIDEAIRYYQAALDIHPDWAEGWWNLGILNYDADRYVEAIPAFHSLIALNPQLSPALAFLGLSEFETKDYENSLTHLRQAQNLGFGEDTQLAKVAKYHLALLLNRAGEFEESRKLLSADFGRSRTPDQIIAVLGMSLLRIPLLPSEVDSSQDALIHSAGEAAALLISGNAAQAAESLRALSVEYPKTSYLHYEYATVLSAANEYDKALLQLAEETKITPGSALPYRRVASIHLQLQRPQQALPAAQEAVRLAPQSATAHDVLAQTLQALGKTQDAVRESEIAGKLPPRTPEVDVNQKGLYARRIAGTNAEQVRNAGTPGQESPSDSHASFEELVQKAAAAQAAGNIDAAILYGQRALAVRPEWEEGWRNLGTVYYATGRYADAVAAFKNSAAVNAGNGNVWALLGLSEFETKDYKNSLIHLERGYHLGFAGNATAVQIAKSHLALLLIRNSEFDRATELLASEPVSGPAGEQVKFALGLGLLRIPLLPSEIDHSRDSVIRVAGETAALLAESKYDQAFSKFEQLVKIAPSTPFLHYAYGSALASASRYLEAEEQLSEETKYSPESALPYLRRSSIALQLRHAEDAERLAQHAVELAPESAEAHCLLGRSWLELGKTAESVHELESARDRAPNSPEVHFALARAYAKSGQPDGAERERAIFERLNAEVQRQRSLRGSQAYGALQNQNGIRAAERPSQTQVDSNPK